MARHLALLASILAVLFMTAPAHAGTGVGILVNQTGDQTDLAAGNGACDVDAGTLGSQCTLRAAIQETNALAGPDIITFNIGVGGLQTITPATPLPVITQPLQIAGFTQPGTPAGQPGIEINATQNATGHGLEFGAGSDGSTASGLIVNRSPGAGIRIDAPSVTVDHCWIGTASTGLTASTNAGDGIVVTANGGSAYIGAGNVLSGNTGHGISILGGSNIVIVGNTIGLDAPGAAKVSNGVDGIRIATAVNTRIGGNTAVDRNVISGNFNNGIWVQGGSGSSIQGNYIGLKADGTGPGYGVAGNVGNFQIGIELGDNGTIGGVGTGQGNVIAASGNQGVRMEGNSSATIGNLVGTDASGVVASGNGNQGIRADNISNGVISKNVVAAGGEAGVRISGAFGMVVQGNLIGTDKNGVPGTAFSNGDTVASAISLHSGAANNTIGGTAPGEGNVIAGQKGAGRGINLVGTGTGNRIRGNSILNNGGIGIDLGNNGVTPNDADDPDTGANNLQNFPVIDGAIRSSATVFLGGILNTNGPGTYAIDVFLGTACDASGNGEGPVYVGSFDLVAGATGGQFDVSLPTSAPLSHDVVTATATSTSGDTSEFSACFTASQRGEVAFSSATYDAGEADGKATIKVVRTGGSAGEIEVEYATSDAGAIAGADYATTTGTLLFDPGETEETFEVPINNDLDVEQPEAIKLTLTRPACCLDPIGNPSEATLTIADNDVALPPTQTATTSTPTPTTSTPTPTPTPVKCKVPKLKGLTKAKAKRKLARAHCRLGKVTKKRSARRLRGKVLKQKPAAGRSLNANSKVAVTLGS